MNKHRLKECKDGKWTAILFWENGKWQVCLALWKPIKSTFLILFLGHWGQKHEH